MKLPSQPQDLIGRRLWAVVNDFAQELECVEVILRKGSEGNHDVKLANRAGVDFGLPLEDVFETLQDLLASVHDRACWWHQEPDA